MKSALVIGATWPRSTIEKNEKKPNTEYRFQQLFINISSLVAMALTTLQASGSKSESSWHTRVPVFHGRPGESFAKFCKELILTYNDRPLLGARIVQAHTGDHRALLMRITDGELEKDDAFSAIIEQFDTIGLTHLCRRDLGNELGIYFALHHRSSETIFENCFEGRKPVSTCQDGRSQSPG